MMKIKNTNHAAHGLSRRAISVCLIGVCLLFFAPWANAKVIDRVVAVVNNDIISLFDLNEELEPYSNRIKSMGYTSEKEKKMFFSVREDVLNDLINKKLTDQEIKRQRITVEEQEIDVSIENLKKRNFLTDEELRTALKNDGGSLEEYRETKRDQILHQRLLNYEIRSKIIITDQEVLDYYTLHKNEFSDEKKYHLKKISTKISADANSGKEKNGASKRIEEAWSRLAKGDAFEKIASQYAEENEDGGDMGVFALNELSPQMKEAVEHLKAGELTPIMKTARGYQFFMVDKIDDPQDKTLENMSNWIREKLYENQVEVKYQEWLLKLRSQSHIKIII